MIDATTGEIRTPGEILERLARPFPPHLVASKGKYRYVPTRMVMARLDDATGGAWSWALHAGEFVELKMRRSRTAGGGRVILAYVTIGTLTIPGLGSRDGRGVQELDTGDDDAGLGTSALLLGADTRALRNAAERFGLWKPD